MIASNLRISVRSLLKNPAYTSINVAGLAVGMTCFLLIVIYVQSELEYENMHEKSDRIVRVTSHYSDENGVRSFARSYPAIGPILLQEFPDIEQTVRFQRVQGPLQYEDRIFNERELFFVEQGIFDVFTFPLERGNAHTALIDPNTAVLTRSAAKRFFGSDDPMGKTVILSDTLEFTVTGIAADLPRQTHLRFEVLLSFSTLKNLRLARGVDLDNLWTAGTFYTYALLKAPEARTRVETGLPAYVERHVGSQASVGVRYSLGLQPLSDIRLKSNLRQEMGPNGSLKNIYVFAAVAIFVLFISCINFMNLATARSTKRAREVGVRKAVGAHRKQLVGQFLGEALLLSFISLLLAAILFALALPWFNSFTGTGFAFAISRHWPYVLLALGLASIVGVLSGSYPAFLLSAFRPASVLSGAVRSGKQKVATALRRALVVFQFTISIGIIAATVIAMQQVDYMRNKNLGFEKDQIAVLPFYWEELVQKRYETLKSELVEHSSVQHVTASGDVPGRMFTSMSYWMEGMPDGELGGTNALIVDPDFVETYGLNLVAGRDFSQDQAADLGNSFILNQSAVSEMGLTAEEAVGKRFRMNTEGPIIGVVEDFHFDGLQTKVEPLVMTVWPNWFGYISVRLSSNNLSDALTYVEETWKSTIPNRPFEMFFLDEDFDRLYRSETRFAQLFSIFGGLAIFISCLGLFGLAAFSAEIRTKEIGVRKVLGASIPNIVFILNRDATWLIVASAVIAAPIASFGMNRWLDAFAYRIDVSSWIFVLSGLLALVLMWLTVAFQGLKAAVGNPVHALRHE